MELTVCAIDWPRATTMDPEELSDVFYELEGHETCGQTPGSWRNDSFLSDARVGPSIETHYQRATLQ